MKILLRSVVVIILLNIASYSQMVTHSASAVWERYRVSADGVSFMLPKMPVRQDAANGCDELRSSRFYVYTEGAVYEFGVYEKLPENAGDKCYGTVTPFGKRTLQKRLDEIVKSEAEVLGSKTKIEGREANRFAAAEWTRLVISEVDKRQRWIELAVHHYADDAPDFDRFLKSIDFSEKSGKEIGEGIESVFGDPMPKAPVATQAAKSESGNVASGTESHSGNGPGPGSGVRTLSDASGSAPTEPVKSDPYRIISQPRARRTDHASCVQGAVRLKITLLASGGIGSIVPVTRLPDGLTENSIAAAKRIVFLPKRVNGTPVSAVVTREYSFSIY